MCHKIFPLVGFQIMRSHNTMLMSKITQAFIFIRAYFTVLKHRFLYVFWPLLGMIIILCLITTILIVFSLGRNENNMVCFLSSKGDTFIHVVEASIRMSFHQRSPIPLQRTLQELVNTDVQFAALIMPDGTILAHSDANRVGGILKINNQEIREGCLDKFSHSVKSSILNWFIAEMEGKESFIVYRDFMPYLLRGKRYNKSGQQKKLDIHPPSLIYKQFADARPLIVIGLNIESFKIAQKQDRIYLFSIAGGMVLMGASFFLILYYAYLAQYFNRRQVLAEEQVRALEEEVRHKEKMAAIGNLAAGVAHEIRNPLSTIKGYATYFGQLFPEGSNDRIAAEVMVKEVERLNRVITDLIGLSRPTDVHMKSVDILPVVEHALQFLYHDFVKNKINFNILRPKRILPKVHLDVDRFTQAFLNICFNAIEAMPFGGEIFFSFTIDDKKNMLVTIKDTGQGIDEKHLTCIFDPYFTTKGQGTGLGLATVRKIIQAHGGEINITSQCQRNKNFTTKQCVGTVVRIILPITMEKDN